MSPSAPGRLFLSSNPRRTLDERGRRGRGEFLLGKRAGGSRLPTAALALAQGVGPSEKPTPLWPPVFESEGLGW